MRADAASWPALTALAEGRHADPFALLGPHATADGGCDLRVLRPDAVGVDVHLVGRGEVRAMVPSAVDGMFYLHLLDDARPDYRLRVHFLDGHALELDDPYRYGRVTSAFDLHLFGEGRHERLWEVLGARRIRHGAAVGVQFAVWAPNAARVSVVGDFNGWDGRIHPMRALGPSGVWELFVPDLQDGERYKFEIRTASGDCLLKADPYARSAELPPATASVVCGHSDYVWSDSTWQAHRAEAGGWQHRPMSIYEVHLGSWMRHRDDPHRLLTYRELAEQLVPYVVDLGCTHVEFLPVMEHPFTGSWGYQVTGFYAPTRRYGAPDDFRALVDACHQAGLGVVLDWVPGHFPRDAHGLARFDGTALYEHADPRQGEHRDWGTLVFNYDRCEVRNFLLANALYWLEEFHVDGLRVDAVASMLYLDYSRAHDAWVPNAHGGRENLGAIAFLQQLNSATHRRHHGSVMIAEESTSFPGVSRPVHDGGLGFTYKWNMGWMHDMLAYVQTDPVHRPWAHQCVTFAMLYQYAEQFVLPFSHDEVVHGKRAMLAKMAGDRWQQFATLRLLYAYMFAHPGKKLLFMGSEFGQWHEWNHDAALDWPLLHDPAHAGLRACVQALNRALRDTPALYARDGHPDGFAWLECDDAERSVFAFRRRAEDGPSVSREVIVLCNFTPVPREGYRVGVPVPGRYREWLNTDAREFGGSGVGNLGHVETDAVPWHGCPQSLALTVPPLGALYLSRE